MRSHSATRTAKGDIRVWDLPTRLFHWVLAALVVALFITPKLAMTELHMLLGEIVLVLVLFRIVWGFVGSSTSRFSSFVCSPFAALGHLRRIKKGRIPLYEGHNPAGCWMFLALLTMLILECGSGLFSNDRSYLDAPLAGLISKDLSDAVTDFHILLSTFLEIAAIVHAVVAVSYLLFLRQNIILPMITGKKPAALAPKGATPQLRSPLLALPILLIAAALVWLVVSLGG